MYKVSGMTCSHCAGTVTRAVQQAAPAARVRVDLRSGTVDVTGEHDAGRVVAAIEAEGYKAWPSAGPGGEHGLDASLE